MLLRRQIYLPPVSANGQVKKAKSKYVIKASSISFLSVHHSLLTCFRTGEHFRSESNVLLKKGTKADNLLLKLN